MEEKRLIDADAETEETVFERALRPKLLAEYVGQPQVSEQMEIFISAARGRQEALDHVLIFGPPGLGKTTLSHIIAHEMQVSLRQTSGPVLEKPGDLAALLTNLEPNDVLFIDEIHRLSPVVEEILYPAMEDYQLDIMIGEGPAARSVPRDGTHPRRSCTGADRPRIPTDRGCERRSACSRSTPIPRATPLPGRCRSASSC